MDSHLTKWLLWISRNFCLLHSKVWFSLGIGFSLQVGYEVRKFIGYYITNLSSFAASSEITNKLRNAIGKSYVKSTIPYVFIFHFVLIFITFEFRLYFSYLLSETLIRNDYKRPASFECRSFF